jgi:hypothetical protein
MRGEFGHAFLYPQGQRRSGSHVDCFATPPAHRATSVVLCSALSESDAAWWLSWGTRTGPRRHLVAEAALRYIACPLISLGRCSRPRPWRSRWPRPRLAARLKTTRRDENSARQLKAG